MKLKLKKILKKEKLLITLGILLLAAVLRFYAFEQRWNIDFDPARDVLVAKEALRLKKIPLIGAFSSAGSFVWGPFYWWMIMFSYFLAPNWIAAPFFLYTLLDLLFVFIMIKIGQFSWGKKGGLVLGLIAAFSTQQLFRSSNVNQPTLVPFFGSLMILSFLHYAKTKKPIFSFLAGLGFGLALSMHFQALNFAFLGLIILLIEKFNWKKIILNSLVFVLGTLLPLAPLIYWDSTQSWKNIRNVMDYFLIGQYRIWVSNRWLSYLGQFWPDLWQRVFGGHMLFGFLLPLLTGFFFFYQLVKKKIKLTTFWLGLVFVIQLFLNRYYRGIRYEGYMVYFSPLIMYFSAFVFINLFKLKSFLGWSLLGLNLIFSFNQDIKLIKNQTRPHTPKDIIQTVVLQLKKQRPEKKFRVYDDDYLNRAPSITTSLFLYFEGLIDEKNGLPLGFSIHQDLAYEKLFSISGIAETIHVYDLSDYPEAFKQRNWINVSPQYVCIDNLEWWKIKEFKSTFSLKDYLKEKFGLL